MRRSVEIGQHAAIPEVVLYRRLRSFDDFEALANQISPESLEVDVGRAGTWNRLLLREDIAEGVVKFLQLHRRWFHRAPLPADPYAPVLAQRLETTLTRHLHPINVSRPVSMTADFAPHWGAAPVLQVVGETFFDRLHLTGNSHDSAPIVHAEHDNAAVGVCEATNSPAHLPEL